MLHAAFCVVNICIGNVCKTEMLASFVRFGGQEGGRMKGSREDGFSFGLVFGLGLGTVECMFV